MVATRRDQTRQNETRNRPCGAAGAATNSEVSRGEKRFLTGAGSARSATEFAETLHKIPALLTTWTRCGKRRCRCNAGRLHGPYHALHWRDGAVQRRRYVRAADVPAVRAILETRREERRMERLAHMVSLRTWRELGAWVADYDARLRAEQERP